MRDIHQLFFCKGYGVHRELHRVDRRQRQMCIRDRCQPTHLAGIPQQPRVVLHTFGREGALPGNGAARGAGSELPQAAGVRRPT